MSPKTTQTAIQILDDIAEDTFKKLRDKLVYFDTDGSYNLFGKYKIKKNKKIFNVYDIGGNIIHSFYDIRNAVSWCIFEYRNKFYDSRRIIDLDRQLASLDNDIIIHKRLYEKNKGEDREIYELKINEDFAKRKNIINFLGNYIDDSNHWQINRFNHKV